MVWFTTTNACISALTLRPLCSSFLWVTQWLVYIAEPAAYTSKSPATSTERPSSFPITLQADTRVSKWRLWKASGLEVWGLSLPNSSAAPDYITYGRWWEKIQIMTHLSYVYFIVFLTAAVWHIRHWFFVTACDISHKALVGMNLWREDKEDK